MSNHSLSRCEIVPLPDQQVRFQIDGREVTCWHGSHSAPRPFFFPLLGPGDTWLTRMGHPGAPNHDHHRSVWFAHHHVSGIDFWSDNTSSRVRQQRWLAFADGDEECRFAFELDWLDAGHDPQPLMKQTLLGAVIPDEDQQWLLEFQAEFTPTSQMLELGKTNFGFLAVRVARTISAVFGGGQLRDSEGRVGERAIFGRRARWMDYSGPARSGQTGQARTVGICIMDHPDNRTHPCHWHVRDDGWMGASVCFAEPIMIEPTRPLSLRYQLWIHDGPCDPAAIERRFVSFAGRHRLELTKRPRPHEHFGITRADR